MIRIGIRPKLLDRDPYQINRYGSETLQIRNRIGTTCKTCSGSCTKVYTIVPLSGRSNLAERSFFRRVKKKQPFFRVMTCTILSAGSISRSRKEIIASKIKYSEILLFFQCCGFMTFWCGSGYADPCLWLMEPDPESDPDPAIFVIDLQDANKKLLFLLITFWRYIYIIFKDKKSKRSHNTVGIKVFLTIFAWK